MCPRNSTLLVVAFPQVLGAREAASWRNLDETTHVLVAVFEIHRPRTVTCIVLYIPALRRVVLCGDSFARDPRLSSHSHVPEPEAAARVDPTSPGLLCRVPCSLLAAGQFQRRDRSSLVRRKGPRHDNRGLSHGEHHERASRTMHHGDCDVSLLVNWWVGNSLVKRRGAESWQGHDRSFFSWPRSTSEVLKRAQSWVAVDEI